MKKLKILFVLLSIIILMIALGGCGGETITVSDITYRYEKETFDEYIYISSNKDVTDVSIEYVAYNTNGVVLFTRTKEIGDLLKDKTYKISIASYTTFFITNIKTIEITKIKGKVDEVKAL